jgi:hypothetical protein
VLDGTWDFGLRILDWELCIYSLPLMADGSQ